MGGEGARSSLSGKAMAAIRERDGGAWTWVITEEMVRWLDSGSVLQAETAGPAGRLNVK